LAAYKLNLGRESMILEIISKSPPLDELTEPKTFKDTIKLRNKIESLLGRGVEIEEHSTLPKKSRKNKLKLLSDEYQKELYRNMAEIIESDKTLEGVEELSQEPISDSEPQDIPPLGEVEVEDEPPSIQFPPIPSGHSNRDIDESDNEASSDQPRRHTHRSAVSRLVIEELAQLWNDIADLSTESVRLIKDQSTVLTALSVNIRKISETVETIVANQEVLS
jgi:hypothetical protein